MYVVDPQPMAEHWNRLSQDTVSPEKLQGGALREFLRAVHPLLCPQAQLQRPPLCSCPSSGSLLHGADTTLPEELIFASSARRCAPRIGRKQNDVEGNLHLQYAA
jgi:hypothetical protein